MLSKEECIKLLRFLEEGRYKELEEYFQGQYNEVYIKEALEAMKKYSRQNFPNYRYKILSDGQLLLRGQDSYFLLYSKELYDAYSESDCEPLGDITNGKEEGYLKKIHNEDFSGFTTVVSKEQRDSTYIMKGTTDKIGACFKKDVIDFAELLLGCEPGYLLGKDENGKNVLLAQSLKGRAYIMCNK